MNFKFSHTATHPTAGNVITPPSPHRRYILIAIGLAFLIHFIGFWGAVLWKLEPFSLEGLESLSPRFFNISQADVQNEKSPAPKAGGLAPQLQPGAPTESPTPHLEPHQLEPSFSANTPSLDIPPNLQPKLDETPTAALPNAGIPTTLPETPSGTIDPAGGNATLADPLTSRTIPENGLPALILPNQLPNGGATENLPVAEGGGWGSGGSKPGVLMDFTDINTPLPETLPDVQKNREGVVIRLSNEVLFDFDSASLREAATPILQKVATILDQYPDTQISVEGHSDSFGESSYNQQLSAKRATEVAAWLKKQLKRDLTDVKIVGYGESRPIVNPQGSILQQRPNRRVEIHIRAIKFEP